jgi:hypothetical protein
MTAPITNEELARLEAQCEAQKPWPIAKNDEEADHG